MGLLLSWQSKRTKHESFCSILCLAEFMPVCWQLNTIYIYGLVAKNDSVRDALHVLCVPGKWRRRSRTSTNCWTNWWKIKGWWDQRWGSTIQKWAFKQTGPWCSILQRLKWLPRTPLLPFSRLRIPNATGDDWASLIQSSTLKHGWMKPTNTHSHSRSHIHTLNKCWIYILWGFWLNAKVSMRGISIRCIEHL